MGQGKREGKGNGMGEGGRVFERDQREGFKAINRVSE